MRTEKKWIPTTREAPAMRRILEAVRRLDSELTCWEDKEATRPLEQDSRERGEERLLQ
jgi:hypothetical protein